MTRWILPLAGIVTVAAIILLFDGHSSQNDVPETTDFEHVADSTRAPELQGTLVAEPDGYISSEYVQETQTKSPMRAKFFGSVVDRKFTPVVGADITARMRSGVVATTTTKGDGSFSFETEVVPGGNRFDVGTVIAQDASGATGYAEFEAPAPWLVPEMEGERGIAIPTIRLEEHEGVVSIRVTTSCDGGLPARVYVDAGVGQRSSFAAHWTDAEGQLTIRGLARGSYRFIAAAPGCGRATASTVIEDDEHRQMDLNIPVARTVVVRVVETGTDTPVTDARIAVNECTGQEVASGTARILPLSPSVYADEHGVAQIEGLGPNDCLWLRASSESSRVTAEEWTKVDAHATDVTLELPPKRTITWALIDGGHGMPPDGSNVSLLKNDLSPKPTYPDSGLVEGNTITVTGWPPGAIEAQAYVRGFGAALLRADDGKDRGHNAAFYPLRTIQLLAKEADGSPAKGATFFVRSMGLAGGTSQSQTDDQGRAKVEGLFGGPGAIAYWNVSRSSLRRSPQAPVRDHVSMERGDASVTYTFPAKRRVVVTLRVDGKAPPSDIVGTVNVSALYAPGSGSSSSVTQPIEGSSAVDVAFAVDEGATAFVVSVRAPGYQQAEACVVPVTPDLVTYAVVDLEPRFEAVVHVETPEDFMFRIQSMPYPKGKSTPPVIPQPTFWSNRTRRTSPRAGTKHVMRLEGLVPGRHIAYDALSGKISEPFVVGGGGKPPEVSLDLSRAGWIMGRVIPPPGEKLGHTSVAVIERQVLGAIPGLRQPQPGAFVNPQTGEFRVRSDGERPITLTAQSSKYRPHSTHGRVTVRGPRTGVELRLAKGSRATIRFDRVLRTVPFYSSNPRGIVFAGDNHRDAAGQTIATHVSVVLTFSTGETRQIRADVSKDGRSISFGGYAPGRYSLWIDAAPFKPLALSRIELTTSDQDLGTHSLSEGANVAIDIPSDEFDKYKPFIARAISTTAPYYMRNVSVSDVPRISLAGLGPGTFRLSVHSSSRPDIALNETITVNGSETIERTLK